MVMNLRTLAIVCLTGLAVAACELAAVLQAAAEVTAAAKAQRCFLLSSFEPGGPDYAKGEGQIVHEHATDGRCAFRLPSDKAGFKSLSITDAKALAEFKNYRWLKADVFNPQNTPVAYGVRVDDAGSFGFGSRYNEDGLAAPPGRSTISVDLQALVRTRTLEKLDRTKLKLASIFLPPSKEAVALVFDNIRLEGSPDDEPAEVSLLDFEDAADIACWSPAKLPEVKAEQPAPKAEWSTEGVTSGKHSLKLTFNGGDWPVLGTSRLPLRNWKRFATIKADLTVAGACVAYFRVNRGQADPGGAQPYWERTMMLLPGRNEVTLLYRGPGDREEVTSLVIGTFRPAKGQVLLVDNIRLSSEWPEPHVVNWYSPYCQDGYSVAAARQYQRTRAMPKFKVLGSDLEVANLDALAELLKPRWSKPPAKTMRQVEQEFNTQFQQLKQGHPKAVTAVFREGDKGCDPAHPDTIYTGWKYAYLNCHGPDGPNPGREAAQSKYEQVELFMRHRCVLFRADLSSIPKGSSILAARLVLSRTNPGGSTSNGPDRPNLWAAEFCNRDWDDKQANCYFYAPGKHWKAVNGLYYGEDPDFWPALACLGPAGSGVVTDWDFTAAVQFLTDGRHENHGFLVHGDHNDYIVLCTPLAKDVKSRPAIMVVYEAKDAAK
jgi:hypothetical protein